MIDQTDKEILTLLEKKSYIEGNKRHILNHYRTSGISCYLMEARFETNDQLNLFLENLNKYANYSVLTVINHLN